MKVEGSYVVDAGIDTVWRWLNDPDVLAECIPGVSALTATGEDQYRAALQIGIGAIRGSYTGSVEVRDPEPPRTYTLHVEGNGPGASISGDGRFTLTELGNTQTRVDVDGDAQVRGVFARVGQRMVGSAAKSLMNQFFDSLEKYAQAR